MQKLTLELDTLRVQSFETGAATGPKGGTVHAREVSNGPYYTCDPVLCKPSYICPSHHNTECCGPF